MAEPPGLFLIVDDEPDMCWALQHLLTKNGYPTQKAGSGNEALHLFDNHFFTLAFLDAKLPDMDGLELARRIRAKNPGIGIVMVSGYFFKGDLAIQKALSEGLISSFISKPFQQEEILAAIRT